MPTCSCGGQSISCPGGCGCFHLSGSGTDYVRWCEPARVSFDGDRRTLGQGGIVRTTKGADGKERMMINENVMQPGPDAPRHALDARFEGCLDNATRESLALVISALLGKPVSAAPEIAAEAVSDKISGTIGEIIRKFGLAVG